MREVEGKIRKKQSKSLYVILNVATHCSHILLQVMCSDGFSCLGTCSSTLKQRHLWVIVVYILIRALQYVLGATYCRNLALQE